jgi:nitrate/nitrite transport system permease protein
MSPLMSRALDPFIQVLKPISPLAWMPLALYTIRIQPVVDLRDLHLLGLADAAQYRIRSRGGAQGVAQRRAHARGRHVQARLHHHPAGGGADHPDRHAHSIGIAWLVIVAAEMLVGWHRHRLFRLERMEQSLDHQRDLRDPW